MDEAPLERRIADGIERLASLRDGERAIPALIACGEAAVAPLRELLFARDPSGIFLPRLQAVEVLSALAAKDVLLEYLAQPPSYSDAVEQAGVDVVASAVAEALARWPDEQLFSLMRRTVDQKLLPGVVDTLGRFARQETIPVLAEALGEDFCRAAAERGFRRLGPQACPDLLRVAASPVPSAWGETEMSRRRRRSALGLWNELCGDAPAPGHVVALIEDPDERVAFLACAACLRRPGPGSAPAAAVRLVSLLGTLDWMLRNDVEDLLVRHYAACRPQIEAGLTSAQEPLASALGRVAARASPP